jgi:AraC-like DNA-binding protein
MTELAAEHGVPLEVCLDETGIDPQSLDDPAAEVTGQLALVTNIVRALPDVPEIGLESGRRYHVTAYGIWGYAVMSSPTVVDALELGLRDLSAIFHMWGQLLGEPPPLLALRLRFPEPAYAERYQQLFGVRPVFDAEQTAMEYEASMLGKPMPQANFHTAKLSEAQCEDLLKARQAREGIAGRIRHMLLRAPGQSPDMERIAKELATTSRSLRRRLTEEGTSFRVLVDEVRETLAEQLLSTAGLSVDAVAERLGFANTAGFISAFKRWRGVPPGAWRAGQSTATRTKGSRSSRSR